jgi:hypothetical protein
MDMSERKFTDVLNEYLEIKEIPDKIKDWGCWRGDKFVVCTVYEQVQYLEDELNSFFSRVKDK